MTIVNHTTGKPTTERAVKREFDQIVSDGSPLIGTKSEDGRGYRARWDSPPTDAQLRTVDYSYRVDTDQPQNSTPAPSLLINDQWVQQWAPIPDEELRSRIVAQIKDAARDHILATLPQWKQSNMTARAVELAEIREAREMTAEESAQHQALHAAWAWVRSVRTASDVAEADVAAMDRAQLDAWTMPDLPEWPA